MLELLPEAGEQSPATLPGDVAALLVDAGFPSFCFTVSDGAPALVKWQGSFGRDLEHAHKIAAIKRTLEDQGYDLATRGAPGRSYLAVFGRVEGQAGL